MLATVLTVFGGLSMPLLAPVPREAAADPTARGFMGITVTNGTLTISDVYANLPAAKAGLKSGDQIVRVGTLQPTDFDQVVAHVMSFRPGAALEIEVQRGGERKTVKLKLTARPPDADRGVPYPVEPFPEP
jgi:S1-C subfamily serine protease